MASTPGKRREKGTYSWIKDPNIRKEQIDSGKKESHWTLKTIGPRLKGRETAGRQEKEVT